MFTSTCLGAQFHDTKALTTIVLGKTSLFYQMFSTFYLTMNRNDPSHAWHGMAAFHCPEWHFGRGSSADDDDHKTCTF
jgi:hypothetical protein